MRSEAVPASASSERAAEEALLKVRKSYVLETASRRTGENGRNVCWRRASVKKEPLFESYSPLLEERISKARRK